ncbi:MAG: nicotinate-nucleotide adenylyltransferase [Abitibacteriaceae bacterium]|nr:nicotinate-nucleotide adenylyltransferase [Abditibacteriaceae bacterium]MBV9864035.1 nicotinate-nucleotide adenylyltransferase [Abditibacteriaceae bacterium]
MRIGLMGGTFDPIHYGHLFLAEEARVRCRLDQVIFFPNHQPAHKQGKKAHLDPRTRYELTALAIRDNPYFQISRIEIDRSGPSYAFDTLHRFQDQFQAELGQEVELFYIVGADSMEEVLTWYRGAELFDLCRFIAGTRPGYSLEVARAQLTPQQAARVEWLEIPGLHIASSALRQRVQAGLPIRYLTPDAIVEEIVQRGLYRDSQAIS